ncbi:MAG: hypothetical protein AAFR17_10625 [Pseudomonadota bacterium]
MKALIATPTAGEIVTTAYVASVVAATRVFNGLGWSYLHATFDGADVVMARNYMANLVLQRAEISHVLFLDSDMAVEEAVLSRYVAADKGVVGAIYPERHLDLARYAEVSAQGATPERAQAMALTYNVHLTPGQVRVKGGFCEVEGLGFGCVLIQRGVLERMVAKGVAREINSGKLAQQGMGPTIRDFFSRVEGPEGQWLSEDYAFCQRVRKGLGEKIWGDASGEVGHVGRMTYGAPFLERLRGEVETGSKD